MEVFMLRKMIALFLLPVSFSVFAQANKFEGIGLGANFNLASMTTQQTVDNVYRKGGDVSSNGSIQVFYGHAISENFLLSIGATYSLGKLQSGATRVTNTYDFSGQNISTIYLEPAYVQGNIALYPKIAYAGMQGQVDVSTGRTFKDNFTGYGYGWGGRVLLSKNIYTQIEVMRLSFGELNNGTSTYKPAITMGSLGFGYKF